MAEEYSRELLRRAVAQVCQLLGWHAMHSSPLAVLTHVLEKYLVALAESAHRYAEHDRRTEPTLDDLACAFRDLNVRLPELKAYARAVPPAPLPHPVPAFPSERAPSLNFLKPGSREVLTRPPHVHDHLPPMWPEREAEPVEAAAPTTPLAAPDPADPFKRPGEPAPNSVKRPKLKHPDDEGHARELSSVMMTVSGFLSPAREGKLPEARTPIVVPDAPPERPKPSPGGPFVGRPPPPPEDRLDKKLKKSKAVNGKVDKSKKKEKLSKNADRPYVPNENRSNRPGGQASRAKPAPKNHADALPPPRPLFFPDGGVKVPIKREPADRPPKLPAPPVQHQSYKSVIPPLKVNSHKPPPLVDDRPKPASDSYLNVTIKEEKMDTEKLTLQPDRSKLNIFKKISTKIKEEKLDRPLNILDRHMPENVTIKIEKPSPPRSSPHRTHDYMEPIQPMTYEMKSPFDSCFPSVVDLSSKRNNSDIVNVGDNVFDIKQKIKQEPIDDYPTDLTRPKLSVTPHDVLVGNSIIKEKKDKKRKERKIKTEKLFKEHSKSKKHSIDKVKPINDLGEPSSSVPFPDNLFPFLSTQPGLIPNRNLFGLMNPGLIPRPNLFTQIPNPALRGLLPHDTANVLPNPFSLKEGSNNLLSTVPGFNSGLIPPALTNPMFNHGFGQPPRMPQPSNLPSFLRRPSLEVIPIDGDGDEDVKPKPKPQFIPPNLIIKEKEKQKNVKLPINNSFISNSVSITNSSKYSPPKSSPVINISNIKPDVTIQLNSPPQEKIKTVDLSKLVENPAFIMKEKEKSEKKKDKLHKKDKKDKEQRLKKKKEKKEKLRLKKEKERDREDKQEIKEKPKKDKKEKKRDREKPPNAVEGLIPKLTLKLGPPSPMPLSPDTTKRLNIKPVIKKENEALSPVHISPMSEPKLHVENNQSPELAKISALVTRPPKSKSSSKHNTSKSDSNESNITNSPPAQQSNVSPVRKTKPPSSYAKYKRIHFKPIPKRNSSDFDDPIIGLASDELEITEATPPERIPNIPPGTACYTDPQGNQVWICPACGCPDNGTSMIACDGCDGWYHWVCVGIQVEPNSEDWYCNNCSAKRTAMASAIAGGQTGKKRGRKPKIDKLKENR